MYLWLCFLSNSVDIFLRKFQDKENRKGRVEQFFKSDLFSSFKDETVLFDLEIGCGHGHWLNAYSDSNTDIICVGIDLISKRILRSNNKKLNPKLNCIYSTYYLIQFKTMNHVKRLQKTY